MGTDSLIVHVKTDDTYKDMAEDVKTRFEITNYETDRPTGKNKNRQTYEEKIKSNWTNEKRTRSTSYEKIFWIKGKNI